MPFRKLYASASQASRYSTNATSIATKDLFQKVNQVNRLLDEIRDLAKTIEENGNAPTREAAEEILKTLKSIE